MNATKRKFNALIQGLGTKPPSSSPRPSTDLDERNRTPGPRNSAIPNSSLPPSPSPSVGRTTTTSTTFSPKGASASAAGIIASSPANNDPTKRRRVGVLVSTTGNEKISPSAAASAASTPTLFLAATKVVPGKGRRVAGTSSIPPEPKFCPGDREQLIRRLATFQELTEWTPKPDKVNEIEWARRGWVCQGKERVRCTLCNKELVVQANVRREPDGKEDGAPAVSVPVSVTVDSEVQEAIVNKFAELIVEAHQEDCLWRKRACDDTLLRLPLSNPQAALASLRERYDDLSTRPSFLPYHFNLRLPEHLDLQAVKSQLPPNFFTEPPPPPPSTAIASATTTPNDVALALALTGWQGLTNPRIGPVPNSASCATCLRRLGLWMFKSKEVDEATGEILVPAPMDHLDPVREHRFFCPWRNPSVQKNPASKVRESKAGWEVLVQTLKNTAYLRTQSEKSNRPRFFHRSSASVPATPLKGAAAIASSGGSASGAGAGARSNGNGGGGGGSGDGGDGGQQGVDSREPATPTTDIVATSNEEEDPALRDAKDKERWARLRRVKSLFDTKNGKRLRRTLSRPSSIAPNSRPTTAHGGEDADTTEGNETGSRA